ncbi:MAG: type III pantothenate kinase [Alistipes sp.]|nr:type III pantothenate kinase [Alistipes sp.]
MNLIVDIGNSFIKAAVVEHDEMLVLHRFSSVEEFGQSALVGDYPRLRRAIVASTGVRTDEVASLLTEWGLEVLEMTQQTPVPIDNAYFTPETLGVDRLAAAVAAVELYGEDCLIVDFGSAITIDMVQGGTFLGGNISPGVEMRFRALHDYTQRLSKYTPTDEILELGRTTREAIEQGVMQGITNEIEGYILRFYAKNEKLALIFTGGDAKYFVKRIKNAIFAKCNLVIFGLNRILEYNATIE